MSHTEKLKVGLAQIAPIWLDREKTTEKVCQFINMAADQQCGLVAFGETLLPGYPFWLSSTHGSKFDCDVQKDIHAHYLQSAINVPRGDLKSICNVARERNIAVMVGGFELGSNRGGHTGYCTLFFIDALGQIKNAHRKLVPTYEERLAWGNGDGNGLNTFPVGAFTVGGLNCWENWLPLPRATLHAQGENLHIAVWPGSKKITIDITRFVALESRSYVVSVSGLMRTSDIPDEFPHRNLIVKAYDSEMIADGGSCVANPDGSWLIEPVCDQEKLLVATLDHTEVLRARQNLDISGHYSRPDVFQISVNRDRQQILDQGMDG